MERQVPAIMLIADSISVQLRSFIFCSAILRTSSLEIVATLSLWGTPEAGGSLGDKRETVVCIDRDDDRDHHSHIAFGALIEILCELPDIDAVLAECRAYRGSRGCLTGRNLESDVSYNFLCQFSAPLSFNL